MNALRGVLVAVMIVAIMAVLHASAADSICPDTINGLPTLKRNFCQ
jgi:hypothetical protein